MTAEQFQARFDALLASEPLTVGDYEVLVPRGTGRAEPEPHVDHALKVVWL